MHTLNRGRVVFQTAISTILKIKRQFFWTAAQKEKKEKREKEAPKEKTTGATTGYFGRNRLEIRSWEGPVSTTTRTGGDVDGRPRSWAGEPAQFKKY